MIYNPQRRREDGFRSRVLGFFKWTFIIMGVWTSLGVFSLVLVAIWPPKHAMSTPDKYILTYTFKDKLAEVAGGPSLSAPLLHDQPTFGELIEHLTQAAKDPAVKGFVAKLEDMGMSPAQLQELRDTLTVFRAAGKSTYIYAETYGGDSSAMGAYYLAAGFGQIWLQPVGDVSMNGIAAEVPFFKGTLDKVGVDAEFSRKGTYKSFPESFTLNGMSPANREMTTGMVNDLAGQFIDGIAASRGMTPAAVKQLVNDAPFSGEEALKLKLIDKLGYYDQMLGEAKRKAGLKSESDGGTISLQDYDYPDAPKTKEKIALIVGAGDIVSYSDVHAGLSGADMAADKIAKAFEEVRKDKHVAAVVFRIDSPGGSPEAAETIRHAIMETQQKGKPVIVSMSGYAASGGYWIAAPADKIVAEPATITGSIGVFGGKFVFAGLWQKLGIHWDSIAAGNNAEMFSANKPFTAAQREKFEGLLDGIYKAFITRVSEGRHMTPKQVEAVAEGHVWTGQQAKQRGLVDELGGLDKAVMLAKVAAKINPAQDIRIEHFPEKETALGMIFKMISGDDDSDASVLSIIGISAGDIAESLQTAVLQMAQVQVR